ncbi:MAG: IS3 family transposase, partial [Chloroflexota bacterium]
MKYQFIEDHRGEYPVSLMCQVLRVSRSAYYAWRQAPRSAREMADLALLEQIEEIFEQSRQTYGSYRVFVALRER